MDNIKITLETLYDILRNEKKREDLQKLESTFFIDVISYMREKQAFLATKKDVDDLFASGEKDKLEYEIRSIKRILKEIYEKREKKILDIALNRSRTGSEIIDTSSMLREEKEFYERILDTLDKFRQGIIMNLFKGELPSLLDLSRVCFEVEKPEEKKIKLEPKLEQATLPAEDSLETSETEEPEEETAETEETKDEPESTKQESSPETTSEPQEMTKIKMIKAMPSFIWKDMKEYGPYDVNDEVEIFPEVAELMIRKGRAEKV
ncbi:DNA replication complex GINS family protein [Candidatus Woesearchaeota archaeon]|jgi:DNA replication initiation complex subunit (GINS family)|nr:DNA replication complex GINS family protein [Candidatus Woesearchaeota archaeon]